MLTELTYKQAPLGKHVTYVIGDTGFHRMGSPEPACRFADIDRVECAERSARRTRSEIYTFYSHSRPTKLSITQLGDQVSRNSDYQKYQAVVLAVLGRLLAEKPDMELVLAESKGFQLVIFSLGILSIFAALAIALIALIAGVSSDRWLAAALPLSLMTLLGYHLIKGFHPWQAPITIPIERHKARIESGLTEAVE